MAHPVLNAIAQSFLIGAPDIDRMAETAQHALGRKLPWMRPLAKRYTQLFNGGTWPRRREVVDFLMADQPFRRAWPERSRRLSVAHALTPPQTMHPVEAAAAWDVPVIESPADLASWLGVSIGELDWFADLKSLTTFQPAQRLRHYRYRTLLKSSGRVRMIEEPKPRIKELQRHILREILDRIPSHSAAHGFRHGRSIRSFVAPHTRQRIVLRMDLQDFFPSIPGVRVQSLFRTAGYPEAVADLLGGICTNAVPLDAWRGSSADFETRKLYRRPHLPQGAPTSPALANLCAYRVDCRLSGLARAASAVYTRYADDLAFSGGDEFDQTVERFSLHVAAILEEEGFAVHHRKTRIMRQSVQQHLAGLVANQKVNVARRDFDELKAILTNCVRHGLASQNRDAYPDFRAHLAGRVGFIESVNAAKGVKLRAILERIA
jgi:hypothetical protein